MLSIGEFSKICKVSTKTLRYYAEIGLILPNKINPENGYRYYSIEQLETMLLINRLKSYYFSLEEIKDIMDSKEMQDEKLVIELNRKKEEISKQLQRYHYIINQLDNDIITIKQGKSIMSYLDKIDIDIVNVPKMNILSIRKKVKEQEFENEYRINYGNLFKRIVDERLTVVSPPMILFHDCEFSPLGLDSEFAVPVKEYIRGTRDFEPGLCIKTVVKGAYSELSSVYAKQIEWAENHGYESSDALFEVYVVDPSQAHSEEEVITEVYYPIKKKGNK